MKIKPTIIVAGEPDSIFFEIFFKSLKFKKFKSPIILIVSKDLLKIQIKKFNIKKKINLLSINNLKKIKIDNNRINVINIDYKIEKNLKKKTINKKKYINNCFDTAFKIIKHKITNKMINGPINKKKFLNKKFLGITEFVSKKFNIRKNAMLIYNKKLSVCPITTHLPIKLVAKKINKKIILEKITLINSFYKEKLKIIPNIAVTGLNPHCESVLKNNEDLKIIKPSITEAKKRGYKVYGPFSADTIFQKINRSKFHVILGMYHDQVLGPIKTIFEYDAINITLGLPFYRITPDHGPNEKMIDKNSSNPLSLIRAIEFLDKK